MTPIRSAWRIVSALSGHSTQQNAAFNCLCADGWEASAQTDMNSVVDAYPGSTNEEATALLTAKAGVVCEGPSGYFPWWHNQNPQSNPFTCSDYIIGGDGRIISFSKSGPNFDARYRQSRTMSHGIAVGGSTNSGADGKLGWGMGSIEMGDRHPQNDAGKSYSQFSIPAKATILMDHSSVKNYWDARRLLRMSCNLYTSGWTERRGYGMPLPRGFSTTWDALLGDLYTGAATQFVTVRNSYTDGDLDDLVGQILANEQAKVEAPSGFHIPGATPEDVEGGLNANYAILPTSNWTVWDGDPLEDEARFGNASPSIPRDVFNRKSELNNGMYYGGVDKDNSRQVMMWWLNFKSSNWKSTVITANDNVIYEGTGDRFVWNNNVTGNAMIRIYSRAIDGSLSREEPWTQMRLSRNHKLMKFGGGVQGGKIRPAARKLPIIAY